MYSKVSAAAKYNLVRFFSSSGAALECFDFLVFAQLASYIQLHFFPENYSALNSFLLFAIGYLARPLGGIAFGLYSDLVNRKKSFFGTIFLMSIATSLIPLIPSYQEVGYYSTLLLVMLRICQGIAFGAEVPVTLTVLSEQDNNQNFARSVFMLIGSMSLGGSLASISHWLLHNYYTIHEIQAYAWQYPFYLGGILGIGLFIVRKVFIDHEQVNHSSSMSLASLTTTVKTYFPNILRHTVLIYLISGLINLNFFLPIFFSKYYSHLAVKHLLLASTICLSIYPLLILIANLFASENNKFYLRKLLLGYTLATPLILLVNNYSSFIILLLAIQFFNALYFPYLLTKVTKSYPANIRNTSLSLIYNFAFVLGSFSPWVVNHLQTNYLSLPIALLVYMLFSGSIAFVVSLKEKNC